MAKKQRTGEVIRRAESRIFFNSASVTVVHLSVLAEDHTVETIAGVPWHVPELAVAQVGDHVTYKAGDLTWGLSEFRIHWDVLIQPPNDAER